MTKMTYSYEYPRPAVTVDCVTFGLGKDELQVLLVQRGEEPFKGCWALPGGFVNPDETLERAARRELEEKTSIKLNFIEQLYTFGAPDRDPRDRVVTVAYFALVNLDDHQIKAESDANDARWFDITKPPKLAFDHKTILQTAIERVRGKLRYQPIGFELLPPRFTLGQLQKMYEVILGTELDKRNFRKKILSTELLIELDEIEHGVGRPARLYRFDRHQYRRLARDGFMFEL